MRRGGVFLILGIVPCRLRKDYCEDVLGVIWRNSTCFGHFVLAKLW
jgi:hypothetical protein